MHVREVIATCTYHILKFSGVSARSGTVSVCVCVCVYSEHIEIMCLASCIIFHYNHQIHNYYYNNIPGCWSPVTPPVVKGLVWYTDGSRTAEGTGAGVYGQSANRRLSIPLGKHATVFQAEVYAILACAHEIEAQDWPEKYVSICSDSQAAIIVRKETSYSDRKFWVSYILFIITIGGILVLHIYIYIYIYIKQD